MTERKMLVEYVRENDGAIVSVWVLEAEVKVYQFDKTEMGVVAEACLVESLLPRCDAYGLIPPRAP